MHQSCRANTSYNFSPLLLLDANKMRMRTFSAIIGLAAINARGEENSEPTPAWAWGAWSKPTRRPVNAWNKNEWSSMGGGWGSKPWELNNWNGDAWADNAWAGDGWGAPTASHPTAAPAAAPTPFPTSEYPTEFPTSEIPTKRPMTIIPTSVAPPPPQ
ncbi:hypothetical protein ACHAXM_002438 [Skeletonema potamos]